jgi:hypothetical protein
MKNEVELRAPEPRVAAGGGAHTECLPDGVADGAHGGDGGSGHRRARGLPRPALIEGRFHLGAELVAEACRIRAHQRAEQQPPAGRRSRLHGCL